MMVSLSSSWLLIAANVFCLLTLAGGSVPYSQYILAPSSRVLYAHSVYKVNGTVASAQSLTSPSGKATFNGVSAVTFDFAKDIAGYVTVAVESVTSSSAAIGLTYTESSEWISGLSSDGTQNGVDEIYWLPVGQGPGNYTVDQDHVRGGFRYLSLISNSSDTIAVTSVSVNFTGAPSQNLRSYAGYFHSNDELLNRIWYAGAYTCQLCAIDPTKGNAVVDKPAEQQRPGQLPLDNWFFNTTITNGTTCLTDGAKRDRLVWPGDMAISIPTVFVSTNDMLSLRNSLNSLFALQLPDGMLPYAGIPLPSTPSWTYHLHNLIGAYNYFLYTGDMNYLTSVWSQFKSGIQWSLSSIDSSGLMNVQSSADWLRQGMGGHNIEANAILYYTINKGLYLASVIEDASVVANWTNAAAGVKSAANKLLWDTSAGLYRDNETATLYPQDGNVWAVKSNLTPSASQSSTILSNLRKRWGPYGAPAPEAPGSIISPFIGGFELEAHLVGGVPQNAIDLMRLQWGFMLNDPRMTNSTFNEGYSTNGALHYVYSNDQRLSHAHGWSTGPTGMLTFYVAGLRLTSAGGKTWIIAPQMGDLSDAEAGFSTPMGRFGTSSQSRNGTVINLEFSTPSGTTGSVNLPGVTGTLCGPNGKSIKLDANGTATGVPGGSWVLRTS